MKGEQRGAIVCQTQAAQTHAFALVLPKKWRSTLAARVLFRLQEQGLVPRRRHTQHVSDSKAWLVFGRKKV